MEVTGVNANTFRSTGKKGKTLHSGERNIVWNVYNFFKKLSNPQFRETVNFNQCAKLCSLACNISEKTVNRVCKEANTTVNEDPSDKTFSTPGKKRKRKCEMTEMDKFDEDVVRRTIFSYYDKGEFPTAEKITTDLRNSLGYKGSVWSTRRLLKKIGFKYRKMKDGRKFLMERSDIVASRLRFLRTMHQLRQSEDKRPVYYLDETWVNEHHSLKYGWQDNNESFGVKVPLGKGRRLIICHVGSNEGFMKDCEWVFQSKTNSQDYHDEMNAQSFKEWFISFLNLLEEGSVIVMDNAPYHSVLAEKIPATNWKKEEIQKWLTEKCIAFSHNETKVELLEKVKPFKNKEKTYELDVIASLMGHSVVRLPPYHCQYNPIELIWAKVKRDVAENNKTFKLSDVETLVREALGRVTKEDWQSRIKHAEKLQEDDVDKECARADNLDKIVINLVDDSDTDSNYSDTECDNDDSASEVLATPLDDDADIADTLTAI